MEEGGKLKQPKPVLFQNEQGKFFIRRSSWLVKQQSITAVFEAEDGKYRVIDLMSIQECDFRIGEKVEIFINKSWQEAIVQERRDNGLCVLYVVDTSVERGILIPYFLDKERRSFITIKKKNLA